MWSHCSAAWAGTPTTQRSIHLLPLYPHRGHGVMQQNNAALICDCATTWGTGEGSSSSAAWQVILRWPLQPGDLLSCVAGVWRAYKLAVWPGLVSAVHSSVVGRWGDVWLAAADLYASSGRQRRRPNPLGFLDTTAARRLWNVGSFACFIPLFIKVVAFTGKLSR